MAAFFKSSKPLPNPPNPSLLLLSIFFTPLMVAVLRSTAKAMDGELALSTTVAVVVAAAVVVAVGSRRLAQHLAAKALAKRIREFTPQAPANSTRHTGQTTAGWTKGKRFAVIVNPNAGGGQGAVIYETVVKPMLAKAGIQHVVKLTERHGHAKQMVSQMVSGTGCVSGGQCIDAICCVSGDGMLHECINGLAHACADRSQLAKLLATVPLAIIPAGSGNGVAASLYGRSCSAFTATQRMIDGAPAPLDTMTVRTAAAAEPPSAAETLFDLHYCCWACFADHDYLTEKPLRWLGPALKMLLAPAIVILRRRLYTGFIDFVPHAAALGPDGAPRSGYSDAAKLPLSPTDCKMRRVEGEVCTHTPLHAHFIVRTRH